MKILSIGNFGFGWDGSICDEEHIARALEELGNEVFKIQREDNSTLPDFDYVNKPIDFILIAQWDGYDEDWLPRLKKQYRCPIVYWAFDYQADGQEWHERLVKEADVYLSKRIADSKYPNWQWLSQDFAPDFLIPETQEHEQDIDVLFTGSYLPWAEERNKTLKAVDEKFNLEIHSFTADAWREQGFKNVFGPSMDERLPELIQRAKVNISIDHTLEAGYWSDRNAQIMACGGFVLFRYVPLSEVTFKDGVAYFYNVKDCLEQIEYFLNNPVRGVIAQNGYYLAQNSLMVKNRAYDLMTIMRAHL